MGFKQCFMKVFAIFLMTYSLIFYLLAFMKTNTRKNREKFPFSPIFLQDLLFWQKALYDTMLNFQKCFLEKFLKFGTF